MHEKHISQNFKSIEGGILVQSSDTKQTEKSDLKIVTQKEPTMTKLMICCLHSKCVSMLNQTPSFM
jgi:AICAR transformylase/IMP cyclohydrolase PurH